MSEAHRGGTQPIPRPERWRVGGDPAWLDASMTSVANLDAVANRIEAYEPQELVRGPAVDRPQKEGRRSAVLVALYDGPRGATVILTKRAAHLRKHAGEISFPGGSVDADDASLWATAVREAEEEIALDRSLPTEVGMLDRFVTGASFSLVQPIVGRLDGVPALEASPDEVDQIIHTPLSELLERGVYRQEEWFWNDQWRAMHFFDLAGETVWGATALMINNLLEIATGES